MDFGSALVCLNNGFKVQRHGWNGKDMFIYLNPASDIIVSEGRPMSAGIPVGTKVHCNAYLMMKTADADATVVPWLASQTDILAEDWYLI